MTSTHTKLPSEEVHFALTADCTADGENSCGAAFTARSRVALTQLLSLSVGASAPARFLAGVICRRVASPGGEGRKTKAMCRSSWSLGIKRKQCAEGESNPITKAKCRQDALLVFQRKRFAVLMIVSRFELIEKQRSESNMQVSVGLWSSWGEYKRPKNESDVQERGHLAFGGSGERNTKTKVVCSRTLR